MVYYRFLVVATTYSDTSASGSVKFKQNVAHVQVTQLVVHLLSEIDSQTNYLELFVDYSRTSPSVLVQLSCPRAFYVMKITGICFSCVHVNALSESGDFGFSGSHGVIF